jgi:hypothetical protein
MLMTSSPLLRSFCRTKEAWYARVNDPDIQKIHEEEEIMLLVKYPDDSVQAEFAVRWNALAGEAPRLEMFHDSWFLLPHLSDLFGAMAAIPGGDVSATDFCALLKRLGFKDTTERKLPAQMKHLKAMGMVREA